MVGLVFLRPASARLTMVSEPLFSMQSAGESEEGWEEGVQAESRERRRMKDER
jgi:hypothetical protein